MSNEKAPLLQVENLKMYFPAQSTLFGKPRSYVKAVDGISFSIDEGKTFGLVGESGCGKTTAGKCILRIYRPTEGRILYRGTDIARMTDRELKAFRREIQLIFQDPYGSLDPRQSIGDIVREAIAADGKHRQKGEMQDRVHELLTLVDLDPVMADRYPHELSGGQRQRLGIARALACDPKLIVCDEPVSALDVSIQAQIINLFEELQEKLGLTYLFIAHDLAVVRHISDVTAVMYLGHIVETMASGELYRNPLHPYTKALMSAVPITDYDVEKQRSRIVLEGEVPSPIHAPSGCSFHPRCPYATDICRSEMPKLSDTGSGHFVACHHCGEV
ncbi:MAG: ATP-binding cassette domain-containing protein [Clostridia bacterium]|nr:ATP-binding cassette domain-containing protein [Clostridia bacterium]